MSFNSVEEKGRGINEIAENFVSFYEKGERE